MGAIAAEYAMDAALMRARRSVAAAPFAFLVVPLHFAMTALMVFVLEIMRAFNTRIAMASTELESQSGGSGLSMLPDLPVFQPHDVSMLSHLTPNPPKDTDGRREDSGRVGEGATGEMAGLHWGRLEVGGRSSVAA